MKVICLIEIETEPEQVEALIQSSFWRLVPSAELVTETYKVPVPLCPCGQCAASDVYVPICPESFTMVLISYAMETTGDLVTEAKYTMTLVGGRDKGNMCIPGHGMWYERTED